jgi:hypothetical protein
MISMAAHYAAGQWERTERIAKALATAGWNPRCIVMKNVPGRQRVVKVVGRYVWPSS